MKKLISLIGSCLFLLSACNETEEGKVAHISGHIQGLGNDTLYLYGTDKYYDRIDTILVKEDKFTATLAVDTLLETRIWFNNGQIYPIYLDKGNRIEIKGKEAELPTLEVTGNLPNKEFSAFQKELKGLQAPSDRVMEEKAAAFIQNHPFSLVSIYLLDHYFVQKPHPDLTQIRQLVNSMSGELKDRPYIIQLQELLKRSEKGEIGKNMPYFRLPNQDDKKIGRSDFKGKHLLVHFWASWDTLSCQQNEIYKRIYRKEKKNPYFAILGISLDMDKKSWKECIRKDTLKWEQVCDLDGWNTELVNQLAIREIPCNLLLSPTGRIEAKDLDEHAILEKLKAIEEEEKAKKEKKNKVVRATK